MATLQEAVQAIKSGDKETGRELLVELLEADENNEQAWLWMTQVISDKADRIACLEKVLEINPDNPHAQRGLAQLRPELPTATKPKLKRLKPKEETTAKQETSSTPAEKPPATPTAPQAQSKPPNRLLRIGGTITVAIVGLCGLCLVIGLLNQGEPEQMVTEPTATAGPTSTPTPDIGGQASAHYQCQEFVKRRLKAPSTAEFSGIFDSRSNTVFVDMEEASEFGVITSTLHNSGVWVAVGEVDAQNSFGVMLRHNYTCVLDYDSSDKTWFLVDISIKSR